MIQVTKAEAKRLRRPLDTEKPSARATPTLRSPSEGWTPRRMLRWHRRPMAGCEDQPLSQSETWSWGQEAPLPSPPQARGSWEGNPD